MAIRAATMAAYKYAEAHDHAIPTTEQLAKYMGIAAKDFQYRVVPSGTLDNNGVHGDRPVLIAEKRGGEKGEWAFGFADGHCTIASVKTYRKWEDAGALQIIREASTKPSTAP